MEIDITEIDSIGIHADWLSERLNQHVNRIEKNVEHIKEQVLQALILNEDEYNEMDRLLDIQKGLLKDTRTYVEEFKGIAERILGKPVLVLKDKFEESD